MCIFVTLTAKYPVNFKWITRFTQWTGRKHCWELSTELAQNIDLFDCVRVSLLSMFDALKQVSYNRWRIRRVTSIQLVLQFNETNYYLRCFYLIDVLYYVIHTHHILLILFLVWGSSDPFCKRLFLSCDKTCPCAGELFLWWHKFFIPKVVTDEDSSNLTC